MKQNMDFFLVAVLTISGLFEFVGSQSQVGVNLESIPVGLTNNAIVSANDITGIIGNGLECFSNDTVTFNIGEWILPDSTIVQTSPLNIIYNLRGPGFVTLYRTGQLTIEGIYTCIIPDTNSVIHSIYIGIYKQENYINGIPVIPDRPVFNLLTQFDQFPPIFSLSCLSTSFPPTNVTWVLDSDPINDNFETSQVLVDPMLTIFNNTITIFGNYSSQFVCMISNTIGSNSNSYTVTAPESIPILMDPDFLGSGNVNITWTPPNGSVYGYQLFYELSSNVGGSEVVININTPDITHAVLYNLLAGATYNISILAYADLPTQRSSILSITLNVANSVENISVSANSSTSLFISWDHTGDNVVRYIIDYTPTGTGCDGINNGNISIPLPQLTEYLLIDLEQDTEYNITISTVSTAAVGEPSVPVIGRTLPDTPSDSPINITVITTDPDMVFISWEPPNCLDQNGPIISYTVLYTDLLVNFNMMTSNITNTSVTVANDIVLPFRNVSFQVKAVNQVGSSIYSQPVYDHLIGNPGTVRSLTVINRDVTSVTLAWNPDLATIQEIFTIDFTYTITTAVADNPLQIYSTASVSSLSYEISNLVPNVTYRFSVTPVSPYTAGDPRIIDDSTTVLVAVTGLTIIQNNDGSVNVSWNGIASNDILFYMIYYNTTVQVNESVRVNVSESLLITIDKLNNERTYDFTIAPFVYSNDTVLMGPLSNRVQFTFTISSNTTLIIIIACSAIGGILLLIVIIIITAVFLSTLSKNLGPQLANLKTDDNSYIPLDSIYIEKEEIDTPILGPPIITGDMLGDIHSVEGQEVVIRLIVNGHPKPSLKWKFDDEEIDWENNSVICRDNIILFKRVEVEHAGVYKLIAANSNGSCEKTVTLIVYPDTEITRHPSENDAITTISISVDKFGQYVASLRANSNKLFREQFKMLSSGEVAHSIKDVLAEENRPYNRFQHIIVYDDNRIKLDRLARYIDCQHEYINACYIKGEGEKCQQFIATQGPLEQTITDIWRLVWQEKCPVIVMLTNTREDLRIKCSQYWPSKGGEQYGPFTVKILQETHFNGYTVREFSVHYNTISNNIRSRLVNPTGNVNIEYKEPFSNAKSVLRVTQYQYTDWLEHSTVTNITSLLEMYQKVVSRSYHYPILVHCSNGVGRTGAFIAIDMALKQCINDGSVDIPSIVTDIRNQRMKMVQTLDQFMLIHDVIIEKIICGNHAIHIKSLHKQVRNLENKLPNDDQTDGYDHQYNILQQVTVSPDNAACSYCKQFPQKNRQNHSLPTDQWRVALKGESPDYINAAYILGYNNPKAFIITQGPYKETRRDFWKMIYDQEITTIVMLSATTENNTEVCAQYWPSSGNIEFGEFVIVNNDTFTNDGFIRRILLLKDMKTNIIRRVVQYQVNEWTEGNTQGSIEGNTQGNTERGTERDTAVDNSFLGVVNTINLVATTQRKTPTIPVLVHCSNGFGRSAMFCVVMATIEQCKVEGIIDVFQFVKKIRSQLPGIISNKEQYKTIHNIVVTYLNIFSTTANFEHFDVS